MTVPSALLALPALACLVVLARASGGRWAWLTEIPSALLLGIGLSSVVWWMLLALLTLSPARLVVVDTLVWTIALLVAFRTPLRSSKPPNDRAIEAPSPRALGWVFTSLSALGLLCALAYALTGVIAFNHVTPHGTWDAWAIWNLRARFFFHGPLAWPDAFSPELAYSHPDYPLLLPLSVARAWTFAGADTTLVPILFAAIFAFATVAVVGFSVARAKTAAHGFLAATAILASPVFLKWAPSQIADIPVSAYMLLACVMLWRASMVDASRVWWICAGVSASLAAWTKNEGTVFLIVFVLVAIVWLLRREGRGALGHATLLVTGAAVGIMALFVFKWRVPFTNDMVSALDLNAALARMQDVRRVQIVLEVVGRELWYGGSSLIGVLPLVVAFALVAGVRQPAGVPVISLLVVLIQIAAYTTVYIVTPHDLGWHINTSLDRVMLQIFPTAVWGIMMLTR